MVRVSPNGDAVIAGRAAPGATVIVRDGDRDLGSAVADRRGEWVLLPDRPLPPGARELTVAERLPDRAEPIVAESVVVLVVPEPKRDLAGRPADKPSEPIALAVPKEGIGAAALLQAPREETAEAPLPKDGISVESMNYDEAGHVAMGGKAVPGAAVQLYLDNVLVGRAHSDPNGNWSLSPQRPVDPGIYQLRADQVAEGGRVTSRVELPVQVSVVPPASEGRQSIIVQPGNSLWRIAIRTYGDGYKYIQIYRSNRSQIRDPDLIYPGQVFELPKMQ